MLKKDSMKIKSKKGKQTSKSRTRVCGSMKPAKILKIAFNMVKANKLRSWLTIIGVIIGIASVMAIVTTGEYFQEQVTETLEGFGGDTITIVASIPFQVTEEGGMVKIGTSSEGSIAENSEEFRRSLGDNCRDWRGIYKPITSDSHRV